MQAPNPLSPLAAHTGSGPDSGELDATIHDCWNQIGVEGNGTCRELARYVHCRNCPVFAGAARQMLNRRLPANYRREQAEHYARPAAVSSATRLSVVLFRLAEEWFALPTAAFQEVAEHRALHRLPHRRHGVALGIVNVRGELLVCVSAARLLGLAMEDPTGDLRRGFHRLLVTAWEGQRLVFPVQEIHGIERFLTAELQAAPATVAKSTLTFTSGVFSWRERTVGLLAPEVFFPALNRQLA